jgi:transposase
VTVSIGEPPVSAGGTIDVNSSRIESVRSTLDTAALTACRCNPVIRDFAHRLKALGKKPKVVQTACIRKFLVILNTMVKNNTHWTPRFAIAESI